MKDSERIDLNENLLGICIPTYNRGNYLKACLNSIIGQISKHNFPIYISDNNSNDNTETIVNNFKQLYSNMLFDKNDKNIGLSPNVIRAISMAKTDYVWLIGDDDVIRERAVDKIIQYIIQGYDYIILNSIPYDINLKVKKKSKSIRCGSDKRYPPGSQGEQLCDLKKGSYHGYISSMIFRRSLVTYLLSKYEDRQFPLHNNTWAPLSLFYEAIIGKNGIFVCEPLVYNRANLRVSIGKNLLQFGLIERIDAVAYLQSTGYSQQDIKTALRNNGFLFSFYEVLETRINSKFDETLEREITNNPFVQLRIKVMVTLLNKVNTKLLEIILMIISKLKEKNLKNLHEV